MRIMIAVPCMDMVPTLFMESVMRMRMPPGTCLRTHMNSLVYDSRNILSLQAIQDKFDYVLWIDSDILCEPDTLTRLLADAEHYHAEMVSGLYVSRSFPPYPVIYDVVRDPAPDEHGRMVKQISVMYDYLPGSVVQVEGCGFGCVLTSVRLLKEVWDKCGPAFAPLQWTGEDIAFCHRVNQLGHTILCDTDVRVGHVGTMVYTEQLIRHGGEQHSEEH